MINEKRIKLMTRMAIFESRNEEELYKVKNYFRSDYIGVHMIKNAIRITLVFLLGLLAWGCYNMDKLVKEITSMDIGALVVRIVVVYVVVLVIFSIITYIIYSFQYIRAKEDLEYYQILLEKLEKEYEREDAVLQSATGINRNRNKTLGGNRHGNVTGV